MSQSVFFQGGTLVLGDVEHTTEVPDVFRWIKGRWRCEAHHYLAIKPWLLAHQVRDNVPRWETLSLQLQETREPHEYQIAALDARDSTTMGESGWRGCSGAGWFGLYPELNPKRG